ncbi:MAG: hypothetical protein DRO67_09050 [Candidatus Asgardarchaeum californiense]|nr:MAG: hypothetical protein DRO67_09050 [Candidatus Asgardarchaeum californiense]
MKLLYKYKAKVLRVVDGDTIDVLVDLGFDTFKKERLRLYGIDTPECRTRNLKEKEKGLAAKAFVIDKICDKEIMISTEEKGKFGRYLALVYYKHDSNDGLYVCLNEELVEEGYAKRYLGGKR